MKLTKRGVESLSYEGDGSSAHIVYDDDLLGFGIRVWPSGRRTFVFRYRFHGRRRYLTLGPFGPVTVVGARKRAQEARGQLAAGKDPRAAMDALKAATLTIDDLAAEHLANLEAKGRAEKTLSEYRNIIKSHIEPRFGEVRPAAITVEDCERFQRSMSATPYQSNRTLFLLGALLKLAERKRLIAPGTSPVAGIERYKEKARTRFLSAAELTAFGKALRELESETRVSVHAAATIRLLLLTGARKSEILKLRWSDVDLARARAYLPDPKNREPRFILLGEASLAIIKGLPRTKDHAFVIEGQKLGEQMHDIKRPFGLVIERAEIKDFRVHDLRHTAAASAASSGMSLLLVGQLLGHKSPVSTKRYAHLTEGAVRVAAERVSGDLAAGLDGESGADVVEMERR